MPRCPRCGGEFTAEELVRHEHEHLVVVHCPACTQTMGTYREPGATPATRSR